MNTTLTLHEAVGELVDQGVTTPVEIVKALRESYGEQWLLRQFVSVIATIAARSVGGNPHAPSPVKVEPGTPRVRRAAPDEDVFSGSIWVEDRGWVALRDLTPDDCRKVAAQYGRLAQAADRHRDWFVTAADIADREGAGSLGEIRSLLPTPLAQLRLPMVNAA